MPLPTIIDSLGEVRFLANLPVAAYRYQWTVYGDTPEAPMFARSEWPALISKWNDPEHHPFLTYVHDQNGVGSCNANATASVTETTRSIEGLPEVKLSAADLYDRINGGGDNGSMLEDAMAEMLARGIGTVATCGELWRRGMKTASAEERKQYRAMEVWLAPTFDHFMSGILAGFQGVSGVMWYDNYNPDQDGWLPTRGSGGGGGHAVHGYAPAMRNGKFGIWHKNSWSDRWGRNGRCVFPEEAYRGPVGGWWLLRATVSEQTNVPIAA